MEEDLVELVQEKPIKKPNVSIITSSYHFGEYLFFGNDKGEVFLFNLSSSSRSQSSYKKIGSHRGKITCLCYNPFLKLLFSGSSDHSIKVWNCESKEMYQSLTNHRNSVICLSYIGDMIISGSIDKSFKFFQINKERSKFGLNPWFKERKFFDVKSKDWITCIWSNHKPKIYPFDVLIGDNSGNLLFLNSIPDLKEEISVKSIEIVKKKKFPMSILYVQLTNSYMIIMFSDNSIIVYDVHCKVQFHLIDLKCNLSKFFYNERFGEIVLISNDTLFFYSLTKNKMKKKKKLDMTKIGGKLNDLMKIDENKIAIRTDKDFRIFKIQRIIPFKKFECHTDPVIGLRLLTPQIEKEIIEVTRLEDEKTIISCSQDSTVGFWCVNNFEMKLEKRIPIKKKGTEIICWFFFKPYTIITGNIKGYVCFKNLKTLKEMWYKPHRNTISSLYVFQYKVKSYYLVSGDFDGVITLCNLTYYKNLERKPVFEKKLTCSSSTITCLNYDEFNEIIIVGDATGKLMLFNFQLKKVRDVPKAHSDGITNIVIDGYMMLTSSEDTSINCWNLKNFDLLKKYDFHKDKINTLQIIPNTTMVISTDRSGLLLKWDYSSEICLYSKEIKKEYEITCVIGEGDNIIYCGTINGLILKIKN